MHDGECIRHDDKAISRLAPKADDGRFDLHIAANGCMGPSKSSTYFHAFSTSFTSFIPVSLFDLETRFFAPTHTCWRPARAGAVKVGRRSDLAARWLWSG